jgi:adenine-specific DNA-methyltransferase
MTASLDLASKRDGRVFTPDPVVHALCHWAIRTADTTVLDLGVGEGAFAIAACERLLALGADAGTAVEQIYGAERDPEVFRRAQEQARRRLGRELPNVVTADFYDLALPRVDAVVGNPPYIRRHYLGDPIAIRASAGLPEVAGLTDAYCYFLLRACSALNPGGRLAVIVSASWLDMKYGQELKRLLLDQFNLALLLGFDGRVFSGALVKPIVILAERRQQSGPVAFGRLDTETTLANFGQLVDDLTRGRLGTGAQLTYVDPSILSSLSTWSTLLKAPDVYMDLCRDAPLTLLEHVAESRIGLQTFAKPFYILKKNVADEWSIEPEYLLPLVLSPRELKDPVLDDATRLRHRVFACDRSEAELQGSAAARYIASGMQAAVPVRGKNEIVRGFHRAPRVARAQRRPWYNLRTAIDRRGAYPILLPRRAFESYLVVHNRAGVVANEDFIELRPLAGDTWVAPLLAFMNSSFGEFLFRSHSFQYGGGVYNVNPGSVREVPVADLLESTPAMLDELAAAWAIYVRNYGAPTARQSLDKVVGDSLGIQSSLVDRVQRALSQLVDLARAATRAH